MKKVRALTLSLALSAALGCSRTESTAPPAGSAANTNSASAPSATATGAASPPALQAALRSAASKLSDTHFFHFVYSQEMKNYDGGRRHRNTYTGDANLEKNAYHYTMTTEGPKDQKFAGEWIVVSSGGGYKLTGYHKEGSGWVKYTNDDPAHSPDVAFLGLDSFRRTLSNACLTVSDDEPERNPKLAGSTTIDGRAVDHYTVRAAGPLLPGNYDIYLDKATQELVRADGVSDGSDYSLTPTKIGEPVTIEEPAS